MAIGDLVYESVGLAVYEAMPDYSAVQSGGEVCRVKAYAESPVVDGNGHVSLKIVSKRSELCRFIPYPYHFLDDGILCALKFNRMKVKKAFALSSVMMSLDWNVCLIFHSEGPSLFTATRTSWEEHGVIGLNSSNSEFNITMDLEHFTENPIKEWIDTYSDKIVNWVNDCTTKTTKKRKW